MGDIHENEKELSPCKDFALINGLDRFNLCCRRFFFALLHVRFGFIGLIVSAESGVCLGF